MATNANTGGATALPIVLAFPPRNKGRIRRSNSILSMGKCVLIGMEGRGEPIPANVVRFDQPNAPAPVTRSPALLLALAVYLSASNRQREATRRALSLLAHSGDEDALSLLAFLREA